MLPQKFHIIPEVQNPVPNSNGPLVFWKKIKKNQDKELHLFLLLEGRTEKETGDLGKELWEMISAYENELAMNQNGLTNPEYVCEAILKIGNDFLLHYGHETQIDNWSDIGIIIAVASPSALYFTRIGRPRLMLFRNNQIILADENLSHPRSPQFSPPFSELAGGPLLMGDRILLVSGEITDSFSWEEISSLTAPPDILQAYYNMVRSAEVSKPQRNTAFILGDVVHISRNEEPIINILKGKLKESRMGEMHFFEFNNNNNNANRLNKTASSSFVPWKEVIDAISKKFIGTLGFLTKIFGILLKPLVRKYKSLSTARKTILVSFLVIFVAFTVLIARSVINNQPVETVPQIDYKALYDKAVQLKDEASSALIYQDEEKARKSLAQADTLLEQVSQSSEWGIKAIKLRQEVGDQLATLDKAQPTQTSKIWTAPDGQGAIRKFDLKNNNSLLLITDKGAWNIKLGENDLSADNFSRNIGIECGQSSPSRCSLVAINSTDLFLSPQDKLFQNINAATKEVSDKKELPSEIKASFSLPASFGSSVYFFDSEETQIKQFNYSNNGLTFKSDWLKQDLKPELKDDPVVSMNIDGSIYLVTKKGNLLRLSGGKKASWNAEKPGTNFTGDNLSIKTNPDDKNLYLLDPAKKRIVLFEKESGKLKGQVQNSNLEGAIDFQIDEKNKNIYFTTSNDLFKMKFE